MHACTVQYVTIKHSTSVKRESGVQEVAVPALATAVCSAARLIGAEAHDCVPVTNATTGITTVLAAVPLEQCDAIMVMSCAYSAVKTAVGRAAAAAGASVVEVEVDMEVCFCGSALVSVYDLLCLAFWFVCETGAVPVVVAGLRRLRKGRNPNRTTKCCASTASPL